MISIKLLSINHETIARFPCREKEVSEILQKLGFLSGGFMYMSGGKILEEILSDADMSMGGIQ